MDQEAKPRATAASSTDACSADVGRTDAGTVALYLTRLFLPLENCILTADPSLANRLWLRAHLDARPLRVISRPALLAQLRLRFSAQLLDQAVFGLGRRFPELSGTLAHLPQESGPLRA
jgi:hypothetical protein